VEVDAAGRSKSRDVTPFESAAQVELTGDLDLNRAKSLYNELCAFVGAKRVVINCTRASFIDSSILTAFMRFRRQFIEADGDPFEIVIVVPPHLRRIFEITGLVKTMTIVTATEDEGAA
jgi:anti-anti-sigma factor